MDPIYLYENRRVGPVVIALKGDWGVGEEWKGGI
jgi:hypothetical protein